MSSTSEITQWKYVPYVSLSSFFSSFQKKAGHSSLPDINFSQSLFDLLSTQFRFFEKKFLVFIVSKRKRITHLFQEVIKENERDKLHVRTIKNLDLSLYLLMFAYIYIFIKLKNINRKT